MKVLFLDIDGVLNNYDTLRKSFEESKFSSEKSALKDWTSMLDTDMVKRLNVIVEKTECLVVLSSSWRLGNSRSMVELFLRARGFEGSLLSQTPSGDKVLNRKCRGDEIQAWLSTQRYGEVSSFCILDDIPNMGHLSDRLVLTDPKVGLTDDNVSSVISILSSPLS